VGEKSETQAKKKRNKGKNNFAEIVLQKGPPARPFFSFLFFFVSFGGFDETHRTKG